MNMDALTKFLSELDVPDPVNVANAIRGRFTVIDREKHGPKVGEVWHDPAVGQVWRNITSGRMVRISEIRSALSTRSYDRILWTALGGLGPKAGGVYRMYWSNRFEFVADSEADL